MRIKIHTSGTLIEAIDKNLQDLWDNPGIKNDKPLCGECNIPMKFKERVESSLKYRIRRFKCEVCGIETTVWGDGIHDHVVEPYKAIKAVYQHYFEQEQNQRRR